jgi:hypothetical protein
MAEPPAVSIVVASFSGEHALRRCLVSLESAAAEAEIIVATNLPSEVLALLRKEFPQVQLIAGGEQSSVFQLRSLGLTQARGRLIGLVEDHCTVSAGWLRALQTAHQAGNTVLGGPIDNGRGQTTYDWALYFCEYSAYMTPMAKGPTAALLAANAAYARETLWSCYPIWQDAFYENEVHDALKRAGHQLLLVEEAVVHSHLPISFRAALAHLFGGGRRFGRYRISQCSPLRRLAWILAAPAVPLLLFSRIFRRVASRRPGRLGWLLLGLPYCLCLLLAWSAGELEGYLFRAWGYRILGQPRRA